jgi:hypothetical protein
MSDQGYYTRVVAYRDRFGAEQLPNGIRQQEITVVMSDDSEAPSWRTLGPAVCHLPADRALAFAFELLALAKSAEEWELAR